MEEKLEELLALHAKLENAELKAEQYEHQVQRLENRIKYRENRKRRERAHRLITRGAAIESILPQIGELAEVPFYELMERIFSKPEVSAEIERTLKEGG